MLHYGPFKGIENAWDDDDFARFIAHLVGNGIYPNPSTNLQVMQNTNMTVVVKPGAAWINGRILFSDADMVLNFDNADGVLKRIDRVVIRLNHVDRKMDILVKKGTFASSPVAPALQRDADYYELALADVLISNGATQITQAYITDTRLNKDVCGIAEGLLKQVDTTTIFNQYMAWFNSVKDGTEQEIEQWQIQQEQAFNDWFATIQGILDGDVAGNLASMITNHINNTAAHIQVGEREKWNDTAAATDIYKTSRSGKDAEGTFTVVTLKRRSDNTTYMTSVLSGGTVPRYTTQTLTRYAADGVTVLSTVSLTLTYDADGDWTGMA